MPVLEIVVFGVLALIAVVAAVMMITTSNAVHSALFLVVVMASLSVFFVGLWAPFVAMVQVAVYAGAIMVLFLFVIMLLGAEKIGARMMRAWQVPLAVILAVVALGLGAFLLLNNSAIVVRDLPTDQITMGSAETIGRALYSTWLFPFEAVSVLLLVAMIGAVVMTRPGARDERKKKSA